MVAVPVDRSKSEEGRPAITLNVFTNQFVLISPGDKWGEIICDYPIHRIHANSVLPQKTQRKLLGPSRISRATKISLNTESRVISEHRLIAYLVLLKYR